MHCAHSGLQIRFAVPGHHAARPGLSFSLFIAQIVAQHIHVFVDNADRRDNPDLAGILYIPALDLAVPYTAGEESSYALSHTFSGTESPVGSISCSEDTDAAFSGMNAVLLGAVPRDGSLFGGFKKLFFQERLLQDQPCVVVFTRTWRRRYQVFAGFSAMNTDPVLCTFSADEKYRYYLSLAESRNALEGMEDISSYTQEEEPFLTLSAGSGKYRTYSRILCCILTGEESND